MKVSWTQFKSFVDSKNLSIQFIELENEYILTTFDKFFEIECILDKNPSDTSELNDFETNYKSTFHTLRISKEVNSLREEYTTYTPAEGKKIKITKFAAEGIYTANSACKLIWDLGGQSETVLWSIRGTGEMPGPISISDTNGVKQLAISCDNAELSRQLMSAYCEFEEI